eukprot:187346-Pelagomonas_calceolata.AAC.2
MIYVTLAEPDEAEGESMSASCAIRRNRLTTSLDLQHLGQAQAWMAVEEEEEEEVEEMGQEGSSSGEEDPVYGQ